MAIVRFSGFESGAVNENGSSAGTFSIVSTGQRTGSYALRVNPTTTATGSATVSPVTATGLIDNNTSIGTTIWYGFAFKAVTLPATLEEEIATPMGLLGSASPINLRITSAGILKIYTGTTLLATGTTVLSTGTWYYIEIKRTNSTTTGAYDVRINGTTEFSATNINAGADACTGIRVGKNSNRNGQTVDFYYDDVYIDNAEFIASTTVYPAVKILIPNAVGAAAGWTNGTGTTFAEVDEVPPESDGTDLTYIQASAAQSSLSSVFAVQDTSTAVITGTVKAVSGYAWAKTGSVTGTSVVSLRIRNNGFNSDTTGAELLTTYQGLHKVAINDPDTGSPWTLSGVDTVQVGMASGAIVQTQRFSAAYIFVLYLPTASSTVINRFLLLGIG